MSTIDKITRLTQQNAEFDMELRKRLNVASANSVLLGDERINQIYEYCIEEIIRKQAEEFYKDFPLQSIKDTLIGDFIRMESFRRKDNFRDFCLALYQQIEYMTNKLCEEGSDLSYIAEKMWGCPAYLSKGKSSIGDRYAIDKINTIVYFLGYKAMLKFSDNTSFREIKYLLKGIYQCRNMNHRGSSQSQWQNDIIAKIIPLESLYYFKFLGVLAQYVEYIKEGCRYIPELKKYSDSIEK